MTNIEQRTRTIIRNEVVVQLQDGKATRRDVADLLFFADQRYEQVHGIAPKHDDAYLIEADESELVAVVISRETAR